jgi:hypothetical protein
MLQAGQFLMVSSAILPPQRLHSIGKDFHFYNAKLKLYPSLGSYQEKTPCGGMHSGGGSGNIAGSEKKA